jgi:4,5-dihydroxyphthalate decarboxylase
MSAAVQPDIVIRGMDYEHTLGIAGVHRNMRFGYEVMSVRKTFVAMVPGRALEVCEFSLANYLTLRGTGHDWLTAIPVFPYRAFRHSLPITRKESALTSLSELAGRRIGVDDYSMTAAVWFRALLREEYGVDHRSITWVTGPVQRLPRPAAAKVETTDRDLETLLNEGALDALLSIEPRDARLPAAERRLRRLLPDPEREERAYYERRRIYPIHHCIVIRNDVLERFPGIADALYGAYEAAKSRAYERRLGTTLVPWSSAHWTRTLDLFGGDALPYGWTAANRSIVERLAANLHEQGFIPGVPEVDRLFVIPATGA